MNKTQLDISKYLGCFLGGAVGDALGAVTEFMSLNNIYSKFGKNGVCDYLEFKDGKGRITDDTQMTLFTAEGLLRAWHRFQDKGIGPVFTERCYRSYLLWLQTQKSKISCSDDKESFLMSESKLFSRRAPGTTCLTALSSGRRGTMKEPINNSKGCGGIMRIAPIGLLLYEEPVYAFLYGAENAALTHGHPSGYLSAGAFASIIAFLVKGVSLRIAIEKAINILIEYPMHEETLEAINAAVNLFQASEPSFEKISQLGEGWVAEETLSIAIYCSLCYENDFEKAIHLAVNHSGDSDSTGAVTGNMVGLINGVASIPSRWLENLELEFLIRTIGADFYEGASKDIHHYSKEWVTKYPPN